MAANIGNEIERLVISLVGNNTSYLKSLQQATEASMKFKENAQGRWRDASGAYAKAADVLQNRSEQMIKVFRSKGLEIRRVGYIIMEFGNQLRWIGMNMSAFFTLPVIGGIYKSVKAFSTYETSLNKVRGLVNISKRDMEALDQEIIKISRSVGSSPAALAEGALGIMGAGIEDVAQASELLEAAAKASAAGMGEISVVGRAVTSVFNAYESAGLTAAQAMDILSAAIIKGNMEANELAPVLGNVAPAAAVMGIKFEEVAGALAAMSRTMGNTAIAATSLNQLFNSLRKPSEGAKKALTEVGLSFKQLRDVARGPQGVLGVLRLLEKAFKDNDEGLQSVITDVRGFRAAMNLLAQDASTVDEVMREVANSLGATDSAFNALGATVAKNWSDAMAAMERSFISFGRLLAPTAVNAANAFNTIFDAIDGLSNGFKTFVIWMGGLTAAIGPLIIVAGTLVRTGGYVAVTFGKIMTSAGLTKTSILALTVAKRAFLLTLKMLPLAIGAVVAALVYSLHPATQKMREEIERAAEVTEKLIKTMTQKFSNQMQDIGEMEGPEKIKALENLQKNLKESEEKVKLSIEQAKKDLGSIQNPWAANPDASWISNALDWAGSGNDVRSQQETIAGYRRELEMLEEQLKQVGNAIKDATKDPLPDPTPPRPESIDELIKQWEKQNRATARDHASTIAGLTDEQAARIRDLEELEYQLSLTSQGLTAEERKKLAELQRQISLVEELLQLEKERQKLQEDSAQDAHRILQDNLTDIEKMAQEIEKLRELVRVGALTNEEGRAAANRLVRQEAARADSSTTRTAGSAVDFYSGEGRILRSQTRIHTSTEKGVWALVNQAKVQVQTEKDILDAIKAQAGAPPVVVTF